MKETEIEDIINMNYRVIALLGIATSILWDCKRSRPRADHYKFDWFQDAVRDVIYDNKPIPPMPDGDLI
jgi:hypothetical protein